jgi:hypothetical protein
MGDPHLGRKFKTGVPLHRIGEREQMQWAQFSKELMSCTTKYHINMGDLFDQFVVAPEIVLEAVRIYRQAAHDNPDTTYVVIEGNHDRAKDSSKASSFDLFANLVVTIDNIFVVQEAAAMVGDHYAIVPYHPFTPTFDLVDALSNIKGITHIFGHWDIQDWGGDNVIPTKLLKKMKIFEAISGHDHLARTEKRDGVNITVTGSMQPYTHAEDTSGELYRTMRLSEIEACTDGELQMVNVRVLLREGEVLPTGLDCLALIGKRISDDEDEEQVTVDTSDFDTVDLKDLLAGALADSPLKDELLEMFNAE